MNKMALLREIINANNARQHSARELNRLAGKAIFPVLSDAEMHAFVKAALAGAKSATAIADFECLRLPALDAKVVAQVKNTSIISMMLLGELHYIDYSDARQPKISVYLEGPSAGLIADLDDQGIFLPDGRQIVLEVHIGPHTVHTIKDIPQLKRDLRDYVLDRVWDYWTRPILDIPVVDESFSVPAIVEAQWGICPVSKESMLAYGTIRGVGAQFEAVWTRDREYAEETRLKAVAFLKAQRLKEADVIARRRKKQEYVDLAVLLRSQLAVLAQDMAMLPTGDKTYLKVKDHLRLYAQTDFSDASAVMKWNAQARAIITSGNRSIVRDVNALAAVLELLYERLVEAPSGSRQDDALRQIEELSRLVSPRLNAASGAQRLMAIRVAVCKALNPGDSCDESAIQSKAA